MNWTSPLDVIVNIEAAGAALGFLVFVIIYASFSNWRATPPGRALMFAIASLDLVSVMVTVHLFTGPYPGIEFVRIVVYGCLLAAAWGLVRALVAILATGEVITVATLVEPRPKKEKA